MRVMLSARSHNLADQHVERFDVLIPTTGEIAADMTEEQIAWLEQDPWITVRPADAEPEPETEDLTGRVAELEAALDERDARIAELEAQLAASPYEPGVEAEPEPEAQAEPEPEPEAEAPAAEAPKRRRGAH